MPHRLTRSTESCHAPQGRRLTRLAALAVVVGSGCAEAGQADVALEVLRSDSAGVEIVVSRVSAEAVPTFATIVPEAELRLGSPMGLPEEQFGAIRDVVGLRNGGLAVLDELAGEVRLFDATGGVQHVLGSKGQGPGELQSPVALLELGGDTIAVFDPLPRRVTRFGTDGSGFRIVTQGDAQDNMSGGRFLPDGRLIGQSHWLAPGGGGPPPAEATLSRDTVVLRLFDAEGRPVDTLDIVPGREEVVRIQIAPGAVSVHKRAPVFARTNLMGLGPQGLWSSANDRFELRLLDPEDGRLVRILRAPGLEVRAAPEIAQDAHARALDEAETADERAWLRTWAAASPVPDLQPAYDVLAVDHRGRVWVRRWAASGDGDVWWVFHPEGALLGSVDVPSGMRITSLPCGSAIGVEQDDLGIDYAVRYAVRGPDEC